jgi:hypothetical protein
MSQTTSYMGLSLYDPYGVDSQVDAITFVNTTTGTGATSSLNVIDAYMSGKATVVVATAAEWATSATVLRANDFGVASDTGIAKRGDGINTWANLDAVDLTYSNFVAAGYTGTQTEFYALLGTISGKQDIMQYATMPVVITGAIVQYTGETTSDYTNGYFYKGGDSAWEEIVYGDPNSVSYDSQDKTPEQKAQARANIGAGTLATKNSVGAADISASAVTNEKLANMAVNTIKGAADAGTPADLTAAQARGVLNVSDGADKTGTVLEATSAIDAIADGDKIILEDVSADAGSQTKHVLWSAIKTVLGSLFVPQTRAVNSKALSADIVLAASDIGAQAKITASGLIKGDGEGGVTAAVAGTDYASPAADITTTLAAADWVGDSAPYYQDVAASGVSSTSKLDVGCAAGLTATQYAAAVSAQLAAYSAGTDSVRIYAYGAKPTVAIPILIRVVG